MPVRSESWAAQLIARLSVLASVVVVILLYVVVLLILTYPPLTAVVVALGGTVLAGEVARRLMDPSVRLVRSFS